MTDHPGKAILSRMFEHRLVQFAPNYQQKRLAWEYVQQLESRTSKPKITEAEVTAALDYLKTANVPDGYHDLSKSEQRAIDRQAVRGLLVAIAVARP